ncbi:MAG: hypothetical protein HKN16_08075 [Saprospiraceae bacterium]|nr:hypothetical protein [Saprospiraceae bacterium]
MRKTGILAFSIFFLSLSLGVTLNAHYCGDKLVGVRIAFPAPDCCCDSKKGMDDCCSDTSLEIQMDVDQLIVHAPILSDIEFVPNYSPIIEDDLISFRVLKEVPALFANPPPIGSQQRRIRMGSLTYYG